MNQNNYNTNMRKKMMYLNIFIISELRYVILVYLYFVYGIW